MKIQSINPSTGEVIKEFDSMSEKDIQEAVKKARIYQKKWNALSLQHRYEYFKRFKVILEKNVDELAKLMLLETGNMIPDAQAEVYEVIDAIDYYYKKAEETGYEETIQLNNQVFPDTPAKIQLVPYGVIGLIMPWNFPFYSPMMYILSSLMTGNTVILKPSEYSTMVGLRIRELLTEAGFDEDALIVIVGDETTGKALVKSDIDKLFFVGSVEAGKDIVANIGIKPVHLEQGGNSAAIVLDDADLDIAVRGIAWAGAYHAGQDCVGIKRVFVEKGIAETLIEKLVNEVKMLRPEIDYGAYIRESARDNVKRRIDDTVSSGAKLLVGGEKSDRVGYWLTPSVIVYSNTNIELVQQETFGNTIPVMIVEDAEEAIERANATTYGLSNAIFSKDIKKAETLAKSLESGMVFINDPFVALPGWDHWVGWKNSGLGSPESNIAHCLKKRVLTTNIQSHPRDFWFPYPTE